MLGLTVLLKHHYLKQRRRDDAELAGLQERLYRHSHSSKAIEYLKIRGNPYARRKRHVQ